MEFDVSLFNAQLGDMGQSVSWRVADMCPCRAEFSFAAEIGCLVCSGVGWTWGDAQASHVGLTGMKVARQFAAFGQWEQGDVAITIPSDQPAYTMGENDRVLFIGSSEPFRRVLTRGDNETLEFDVVGVLEHCFWKDATTGFAVATATPTVNDQRQIVWASGSGPPVGTQYSIRGRKVPEFYVFKEWPQDRAHFNGLRLPRRVTLRRFDLFGRSSVG